MDQPFVHRLRVRYVECDMQGIVFNSHYYTWVDVAHTEWIRSLLGPLSVLHGHGVDVVVAESSARYLASARFDEEIDVEVRLTALTSTSMTTTHTFRRDGDLLARAWIRHVCVDGATYAKTTWPAPVRAVLEPEVAPEA